MLEHLNLSSQIGGLFGPKAPYIPMNEGEVIASMHKLYAFAPAKSRSLDLQVYEL